MYLSHHNFEIDHWLLNVYQIHQKTATPLQYVISCYLKHFNIFIKYFSEIFGRKIMDDLTDCKKQSHDTNSFTEHQILDQCKTKGTENFFKCDEGLIL
jgi:hypothetical protein